MWTDNTKILTREGIAEVVTACLHGKGIQTERTNPAEAYREKGLNGLYAHLRRNGIKYKTEVVEFGLSNKKTIAEKEAFLSQIVPGEMRLHYYGRMVKSKRSGFCYNVIRAIVIYF